MKEIQGVMSMIHQLADLNKISDSDLMAACLSVGVASLFIQYGSNEEGLQKCQEILKELAEKSWKTIQEAKKEMGIK